MPIVDGKLVIPEEEQPFFDKIVQERVARAERKAPEDYDDLRGIAELAQQYGFKGSPAEIRQQMAAHVQQEADERELEELQALADDQGISPKLQKQINDLQKKVDGYEAERRAGEKAKADAAAQESAINAQIEDFKAKYPDVDLDELDKDDRFIKFARKRTGTLAEKYEEYREFVGDVETSTATRRQSKEDRSTTGGSRTGSANYGLTDHQIKLAKEAGMGLKEYADSLATIKRR